MSFLLNWKLNKKQAQSSIYNTKTHKINEYPSLDKVKAFINNNLGIDFSSKRHFTHKQYHDNENMQIKKYVDLKFNKKENKFQTKLYFPKHRWGRIIPTDYLSLSVFHRPTRHAFCEENYKDIDVKNCSQVVILTVCKNNSYPAPKLEEYCNNREPILEDIKTFHNCNRDTAKRLFISLSFGGSYDNWIKENDIVINDKMPFMLDLETEYSGIMTNIYENNKVIIDDVEKANPLKFDEYNSVEGKEDAKKRCCMALFYQTVERHITENMIRYLVECKNFILEDIVPCQDGFMILKHLWYDAILTDLEKVVNMKMNFQIQLSEKPFDEAMHIPTLETVDISNDETDEEDDEDTDKFRLYRELFTSGLMAYYFKCIFGNQFIFSKNKLYFYNKIYWEEDDANYSNLIKFIDSKFSFHLMDYSIARLDYKNKILSTTHSDSKKDLINGDISKINGFIKNILTIKKHSIRKDIVKDIIVQLTNNDIEFDNQPHLFAFKNCVFDLRTGLKVPPKPEYYLTATTGYKYDEKYDPVFVNILNTLIDGILPVVGVKHYFLSILATGLTGVQVENVFIFSGEGGNGKSLLNELFLCVLGFYGYKLPSVVLQSSVKTGANPELANLHKKRYVVAQEPDHNKKFSMGVIKDITGGKTINARTLYSDGKNLVFLCLTLCIECNTKPPMDEVLDAVIRRLRVIPFITKSVEQAEYDALAVNDRVNVNVKNTYYKSVEFQEKFKQAFFEILKPYAKAFYANNCELPPVPPECAKENRDYLAVSDDLFSWFNEFFEPLQPHELGGEFDKPIALTDIYKRFSSGDFYLSLPKIEKRKFNRKGFLDTFEKNIFLRKNIKRRSTTYNKKQLNYDCIVGWKLFNDEVIKEEEEEEVEYIYEEV